MNASLIDSSLMIIITLKFEKSFLLIFLFYYMK